MAFPICVDWRCDAVFRACRFEEVSEALISSKMVEQLRFVTVVPDIGSKALGKALVKNKSRGSFPERGSCKAGRFQVRPRVPPRSRRRSGEPDAPI